MDIRQSISKPVCNQYEEEGYNCPSQPHQNTFTIAVNDNLHHNLTSATATSSYNGTTRSIFQHADTPFQPATFRIDTSNTEKKIKNGVTRVTTIK